MFALFVLQHCKIKTVCKKYKTCRRAIESERAENSSCPATNCLAVHGQLMQTIYDKSGYSVHNV